MKKDTLLAILIMLIDNRLAFVKTVINNNKIQGHDEKDDKGVYRLKDELNFLNILEREIKRKN